MSDEQIRERAAGALLGVACGDALGVPYEFGSAVFDSALGPQPIGGGLGDYAPGEWSDDTQMMVCIARAAASELELDSPEGLDAIARGFLDWMDSDPSDVGAQTAALLTDLQKAPRESGIAATMTSQARALHEKTGRTAGNGALMRTAPVALAFLDDRKRTAAAARTIAELSHADPLAGDSCVLWCEAIRATVLTGRLTGPDAGLDLLPSERAEAWQALVDGSWRRFGVDELRPNGFTVTALYAALYAVDAAMSAPDAFRTGITQAVAIGDDTDTVAAIAGALLGAGTGATGVPEPWREVVHGWPGLRADDLTAVATRIVEPFTDSRP